MSIEYLNNLCKGCFAQLQPGNLYCPVCGYDQNSAPDTSYQLPPRTILNGKFVVGKVLGEGGFGITYIGHDMNLQVKVAIKEFYPTGFVSRTTTVSTTVNPAKGQHGEFFIKGRDKFVDEARRLAKFSNLPGIVMVKDFFIENGTAYIVMEFVEGQTLKEYLVHAGGRLPPEQVLEMIKPVFASLAKIHEKGIIHRDISPDNLMISRDGSLKLLDFGAAREFGDDSQKSMSVMLKHGYAPMEQYSTKSIQGAHTDVYAISATIYKAITGVTPEGSMDRVISDTVQPPSRLGVYLPGNQEAALMKGLALRQEDRYQSISELSEGLFMNRGQVYNPVPVEPPKPNNKKPIIIISSALAACLIIALVALFVLPGLLVSPITTGTLTPGNVSGPNRDPNHDDPRIVSGAWHFESPDGPTELVLNENGRWYWIFQATDWEDKYLVAEGTFYIKGDTMYSTEEFFIVYDFIKSVIIEDTLNNIVEFTEKFSVERNKLILTGEDGDTREYVSIPPSNRWSFEHKNRFPELFGDVSQPPPGDIPSTYMTPIFDMGLGAFIWGDTFTQLGWNGDTRAIDNNAPLAGSDGKGGLTAGLLLEANWFVIYVDTVPVTEEMISLMIFGNANNWSWSGGTMEAPIVMIYDTIVPGAIAFPLAGHPYIEAIRQAGTDELDNRNFGICFEYSGGIENLGITGVYLYK